MIVETGLGGEKYIEGHPYRMGIGWEKDVGVVEPGGFEPWEE